MVCWCENLHSYCAVWLWLISGRAQTFRTAAAEQSGATTLSRRTCSSLAGHMANHGQPSGSVARDWRSVVFEARIRRIVVIGAGLVQAEPSRAELCQVEETYLPATVKIVAGASRTRTDAHCRHRYTPPHVASERSLASRVFGDGQLPPLSM